MILQGTRIFLRPVEPGDAELVYKWRNDPAVIFTLVGFCSLFSLKNAQAWCDRAASPGDDIRWMIVPQGQMRPIGYVGLYRVDQLTRSAEFGILIGEHDWWGKGIGTEATLLTVHFAFHHLGFQRVSLNVLASNLPARRVFQKCGFKEEGVLRQAAYRNGEYVDIMLMGVLRNEFPFDQVPGCEDR